VLEANPKDYITCSILVPFAPIKFAVKLPCFAFSRPGRMNSESGADHPEATYVVDCIFVSFAWVKFAVKYLTCIHPRAPARQRAAFYASPVSRVLEQIPFAGVTFAAKICEYCHFELDYDWLEIFSQCSNVQSLQLRVEKIARRQNFIAS
jgi:hypothetical protein